MKRIITIILILTGIASFLFYPSIWFIISLLIAIVGLFVIFRSPENKILKKVQPEIDRLKLEGHKIFVNFDDCEILTNNYHKEVPRSSNYRAQAFDTIFDSKNAVENIAVIQSRITYKDPINNFVYVSPLIFKDKITISFLLDKYKDTYVYVDRNNQGLYYFDLEFITSSE